MKHFRPIHRQNDGQPIAAECEPTFSLERHIEAARAEYDGKHGEGAWQRMVDEEWNAA